MTHYRQQVVVTIDFEFNAETEEERASIAAENFEAVDDSISFAIERDIPIAIDVNIDDVCDEVPADE
jgi:hypothetical protein